VGKTYVQQSRPQFALSNIPLEMVKCLYAVNPA
jgi:hypothetical protein